MRIHIVSLGSTFPGLPGLRYSKRYTRLKISMIASNQPALPGKIATDFTDPAYKLVQCVSLVNLCEWRQGDSCRDFGIFCGEEWILLLDALQFAVWRDNNLTERQFRMPDDTITSDPELRDNFGRRVNYVRISVTDRCDFRCVYCMSEKMTFMPRAEILSLEEIVQLGRAFTELGVDKIRITGGEPLVRRNVLWLLQQLAHLPYLRELVLTTNGSQLARLAQPLHEAGVRRINISLDSLRSKRFRQITRVGDLAQVLRGIDAALDAGFDRVKINSVILRNRNNDEVTDLLQFAIEKDMDISYIEEMPLGVIGEHDRAEAYYSSDAVLADLQRKFTLIPTTETSGGPARYYRIKDSRTRVGLISPHSHNFCSSCNRVRVTAQGRLLLCLGQEHSMDLRAVLRSYPDDLERIKSAIRRSMAIKPKGHDFNLREQTVILRHMSVTGG